MSLIELIRCSNCGCHAERHHLALAGHLRTECDTCDYLLILDTKSGQVVEFQAPGTDVDYLHMRKKRLFRKASRALPHMVPVGQGCEPSDR